MLCKGEDITGIELKVMRIRKGLKQYAIAAAVGIAPCRLSEIEAGRRQASPGLLAKIIEALENGKSTNC